MFDRGAFTLSDKFEILERLSLGCTVQYGERERPEPPGAIRFRGPGRSRSPYCICRLPYTDMIFALVSENVNGSQGVDEWLLRYHGEGNPIVFLHGSPASTGLPCSVAE